MTFLDFFAGIGGFRRGMELAGHKCVGFCENDKFANASYRSMHTITDTQREYLARHIRGTVGESHGICCLISKETMLYSDPKADTEGMLPAARMVGRLF